MYVTSPEHNDIVELLRSAHGYSNAIINNDDLNTNDFEAEAYDVSTLLGKLQIPYKLTVEGSTQEYFLPLSVGSEYVPYYCEKINHYYAIYCNSEQRIEIDLPKLNKIREFYSTNPSTLNMVRFEMLITAIEESFPEICQISPIANFWNELIKTKSFSEESTQTLIKTPNFLKYVYQGLNALLDTLMENKLSIPVYLYDLTKWLTNKFPITQLIDEKYGDAYKSASLINGLRVHAPEKLIKAVEHIAKNTLFDLYKEDWLFVSSLLNEFEDPKSPLPKSLISECLRGINESYEGPQKVMAQARALQLKIKGDSIVSSNKYPLLSITKSL